MNGPSFIRVYFQPSSDKIFVGRLALKARKIFFEYDPGFLQMGVELSPFKLPLKAGVFACEDPLLDGLFGVFNDSLPDGWGRLLLDRALLKKGLTPDYLSPLDRLRYVGHKGMGALVYEPEIEGPLPVLHEHLDEIAEEAFQFQFNNEDKFVEDLLARNGSSAGARPKILTSINNEHWIIKFRSVLDAPDIGPIEYAYHLMAKAAGLDVPHATLFSSKNGWGYFGVKRFDRVDGKNIHMHTVSGLLHADHRLPSLDYEAIMKATLWLTKDVRECEKQFKAALFNIFSHNRDDHAKNFAFLMDEKGRWQVSPSYDLVFSSGPSGEHSSTVMGEGKNPGLSHLIKLSEVGGIKKQKAMQMIEEVSSATSQWIHFANQAGVTLESLNLIQQSLDRIRKSLHTEI